MNCLIMPVSLELPSIATPVTALIVDDFVIGEGKLLTGIQWN